jgi:uncharacterized protein
MPADRRDGRRAWLPERICWLHPDFELGPSPIAGLGLFARAPISPGTVVGRVGGRLVSSETLREIFAAASAQPDPPYVDTIMVAEDLHLILPAGQLNHYGNHCCDPNLWWIDAFTLAARRPIGAGDEVTSDYGTSTGEADFAMPCSCGSALCRGTITGNDWRRDDLRARYQDHWVPVLMNRIRQR